MKNSFVRKGLTLLIAIAMLVAFASCGEQETQTIESFMVANPEVAADIDAKLGELPYKGMTVSIEYKDDNCTLTYKFDETYDKNKVKQRAKAFEDNANLIDKQSIDLLDTIIKGTDFKNPSMTVRFLNGDDTEIWSKEYKTSK